MGLFDVFLKRGMEQPHWSSDEGALLTPEELHPSLRFAGMEDGDYISGIEVDTEKGFFWEIDVPDSIYELSDLLGYRILMKEKEKEPTWPSVDEISITETTEHLWLEMFLDSSMRNRSSVIIDYWDPVWSSAEPDPAQSTKRLKELVNYLEGKGLSLVTNG